MFDQLFSGNAAFFALPALVGTAVFLVKCIAMLSGADADGLADAAGPEIDLGDVDVIDGDAGDASDQGFQVISLQSIAAFLMGGGWGGIGAYLGSGLAFEWSLLVALGCGVGMVWLLGVILRGIHDLNADGTVHPRQAVGLAAEVETTIPARRDGFGRVRVTIGDRLKHYDAITEGDALPRSTRVRVSAVDASGRLLVHAD